MFFKPNSKVPTWAKGVFDQAQFEQFGQSVCAYFDTRNMAYKKTDFSEAHIEVLKSGADDYASYGLNNLMEICVQYDGSEWDDIVVHHFDNLFASQEFHVELESKLGNYDEVKQYVASRIYGEGNLEYMSTVPKRKIVEGLYECLVLDTPYSVSSLEEKTVAAWTVSEEELFAASREHVMSAYSYENDYLEEADLTLIQTDGFFCKTNIDQLNQDGKHKGTHGTLFGIPTSKVMLAVPINETNDVMGAGLKYFVSLIIRTHSNGPYPNSQKVFWLKDGELHEFGVSIVDDTLHLIPSDQVTEWMGQLAE